MRYPVTITTVGFLLKNRRMLGLITTNTEGQTTPITQKCTSFSSEQHKGVTGIQYQPSNVYQNVLSSSLQAGGSKPRLVWNKWVKVALREQECERKEDNSRGGFRSQVLWARLQEETHLLSLLFMFRLRCGPGVTWWLVQSFSQAESTHYHRVYGATSFSFPTKINIRLIFIVAKAKQLNVVA